MKEPQKTSDDMEIRSEKVRKLLGEMPSWIIQWGGFLIFILFLIMVLVVCFVPYPNSRYGESILQHLLFF